MGIKDTLDKVNFLNIARSELKSAGYIIAANQVVSSINKIISSTAKKTKNKKVQDVVESTPGKAALNFAIAAGAKKLPKIGDSDPVKYISSGLRIGSIAKVGNAAIDKVFGRGNKKEEEKTVKEEKVRVQQSPEANLPDEDWKNYNS